MKIELFVRMYLQRYFREEPKPPLGPFVHVGREPHPVERIIKAEGHPHRADLEELLNHHRPSLIVSRYVARYFVRGERRPQGTIVRQSKRLTIEGEQKRLAQAGSWILWMNSMQRKWKLSRLPRDPLVDYFAKRYKVQPHRLHRWLKR